MAGEIDVVRHLLEEGARSYLAATTAVIAFEREVQKRCRAVLNERLDKLNSALQIKPRLTSGDIQDAIWPKSSDEFDGTWRNVGVAIEGKTIPPNFRWWGLYVSLDWEAEESYLGVSVGEYIAPATTAEKVFQTMHTVKAAIYRSGSKEGGLWQQIKVEDSAHFEEPLGAVVEEWIALRKNAGGMKGIFKG